LTAGFTIWFTGLSGAGKTTVSRLVESELRARGYKVEVLDGDVVRENLSKGLGFSKEDRDTNIRRIGFVCELLTRNDVVAIAAAISPYRAVRDENRARVGGRFVEVYCRAPLEVLAERDVKGLYKKALRGEIKNFTGVDDPYEPPLNPEVVIESDQETPEESAAKVLAKLVELKYIRARKTRKGAKTRKTRTARKNAQVAKAKRAQR
jgi:adenylyl-sulfate kinase